MPSNLNPKVKEFCDRNEYDQALTYIDSEIAKQAKDVLHYQKGLVLNAIGRDEDAFDSFYEAIELNPQFADAWSELGQILVKHGEIQQAIDVFTQAMAAEPDNISHKENLVKVLTHYDVRFSKYNDHASELTLECLKTPELHCMDLGMLWHDLFKLNPNFKSVYRTSNVGGDSTFNVKAFDKCSDYSVLLDPFLIYGLKKVLVKNPVFEGFVQNIRNLLMTSLMQGDMALSNEDYLTLSSAVAAYCYRTEYIISPSEYEGSALSELKLALSEKSAAFDEEDYLKLCLYACYDDLTNIEGIRELLGRDDVPMCIQDIISQHIIDHDKLAEIGKTIKSVTDVQDDVSVKVQEQYQENPYPKWGYCSPELYEPAVLERLMSKDVSILVAGCGTGHEAVTVAMSLPDAQLTAVDLSKPSLAYAKMKTEEFGLTNIEFLQGDILKLTELNTKFDAIFCGGVLHHMKEPEKGWAVLKDLLKPDGVMRIALYSEIARRPIQEAIDIIKNNEYTADKKGMRRFREKCRSLVSKETWKVLSDSRDYYVLSEYRDLLFHAQEHQFTTLRVKEALEGLDLSLMYFDVNQQISDKYKKTYPEDQSATDLEKWHKFEERHPGIFRGMYTFWCSCV